MKRQLEPRCFKTDEELLDYYEMKAVDAYERCDDDDDDDPFEDIIPNRSEELINKIK
jgi:hypothetical protein